MRYQMGFQHVALGSSGSVSHIACFHGDQQSLFVCCVWGGPMRNKFIGAKRGVVLGLSSLE